MLWQCNCMDDPKITRYDWFRRIPFLSSRWRARVFFWIAGCLLLLAWLWLVFSFPSATQKERKEMSSFEKKWTATTMDKELLGDAMFVRWGTRSFK